MTPEKLTLYMARAGLSVLTFCVVLSIASVWLNTEFPQAFPHLFDGKEITGNPGSPNYVRNSVELISFLAVAITAAVALWAIYFARQQVSEASNSREEAQTARLSSIYMHIVERWNSDVLLTARRKLFELVDIYRNNQHDADFVALNNERNYVSYYLHALRDNRNLLELYSYTVLIQFFEDLGLMCYKRYIRQEDVFDFMGNSIIT
jgi:hypothetical protein